MIKPPKKFAVYLSEKPISQAKLNEPFRRKDKTEAIVLRGSKFVEKYRNGEAFELTDGRSVQLKKDPAILAKLEDMEKAEKAGHPKPYVIDKINFEIEGSDPPEFAHISPAKSKLNFAKTADFGGAGAVGNPEPQEGVQCWFCAASMVKHPLGHEGAKFIDGYDQVRALASRCEKYVKGVNPKYSPDGDSFVVGTTKQIQVQWEQSFVNTANMLYNKLEKGEGNVKYEFHRDSPTTALLKNTLFIRAAKNTTFSSGESAPAKDKWNPADIWAIAVGADAEVAEYAEKVKKDPKFDLPTLNSKMYEWYKAHKVIGISLKQLETGHPGDFEIINEPLGDISEGAVDEHEKDSKAAFHYIGTVYGSGNAKKEEKKKSAISSSYSNISSQYTYHRARKAITWRLADSTKEKSFNAEIQGSPREGKINAKIIQRYLAETFADFPKSSLGIPDIYSMTDEDKIEEILAIAKKLDFYNKGWDFERDELDKKQTAWLTGKLLAERVALILSQDDEAAGKFVYKIAKFAASKDKHSSVHVKVGSHLTGKTLQAEDEE